MNPIVNNEFTGVSSDGWSDACTGINLAWTSLPESCRLQNLLVIPFC